MHLQYDTQKKYLRVPGIFYLIYLNSSSTKLYFSQPMYEGNGKSCHLSAECRSTSDCGYHSICNQGSCECDVGFERDSSDL